MRGAHVAFAAKYLIRILALSLLLTAASAHADGTKVTIPLITEGKPDAGDTAVTGYLFQPEGPGRFPAVILLHGCDGLGWPLLRQGIAPLLRNYAQRFVRLGYVALVLDSFETRSIRNACNRPLTVSPARRAWDAFSAARYLAGTGRVDPDRLILEGHSHGAVAVLVATEQGRWHLPEHFAAGIAWYPGCGWTQAGLAAPVLILIGDADDWTKADVCRRFAERIAAGGQGADLVLKVYPDATHAFDAPGEPRVYAGHPIKPDPALAEQAWTQVVEFLGQRIGR